MPNLANTSRTSSANVHLGPKRNYDAEMDYVELVDRPEFAEARKDIERFINQQKQTTVGAIKQAFEGYVDIVQAVLTDLKLDDKCDFDESSPAPTRVYARGMKRIHPMHFASSSTHREKNAEPFEITKARI